MVRVLLLKRLACYYRTASGVISITCIITKPILLFFNNYYYFYRVVHSPDVVSNAFKNDFFIRENGFFISSTVCMYVCTCVTAVNHGNICINFSVWINIFSPKVFWETDNILGKNYRTEIVYARTTFRDE